MTTDWLLDRTRQIRRRRRQILSKGSSVVGMWNRSMISMSRLDGGLLDAVAVCMKIQQDDAISVMWMVRVCGKI